MLCGELSLFVTVFFSFLFACVVSWYSAPLLMNVAKKIGIIDMPDGRLKTHAVPTPYLGGLVVYIGLVCALALFFPFEHTYFLFLLGITLLLLIGLIDDMCALLPHQKFLGQLIATVCFLKGEFFLKELFFSSNSFLYCFAWKVISALWILTMVNAINLVDVMDGLAVVISMTATGFFLLISLWFGLDAPAILFASFLGALLGFFFVNKPPAKMYLGDAGSLFIGGFLAVSPFLFSWSSSTVYGTLVPVVILIVPLLELIALIIVRTYKGIAFYKGSPDHFSIYFQRAGWSKLHILAYIFLVGLVSGVASLFFVASFISLPLFLFLVATMVSIWIVVLRQAAIKEQGHRQR